MKEITVADVTITEDLDLWIYEVNVTLDGETAAFNILTKVYQDLIRNDNLSKEQISKNMQYIKENFDSIKSKDEELAEQLNILNQFFNKYSLKDLKKFIRDEMGESWHEDEEEVLLSTDEYNEYLEFSEGVIDDGKLEIWFEDSEVLYFGHALLIQSNNLELDSVELHG